MVVLERHTIPAHTAAVMGGQRRGSERNLLGRGSLLTVTPLIVLGLAVFVIALNIR